MTMISIIMPIYNRSEIVLDTLLSIQKQSFKEWECIIVDDGSTDNTIEVLRKFELEDSRFKIYKRTNNFTKGASGCRNYAFQLSKGNYIQFFDSDDIMHSDHLYKKYQSITKENYDFVVCKLKKFTKQYEFSMFSNDSETDFKDTDSVFEDFVTGRFPMMMQMPMWKRATLKPYFPINENMVILEDHEFYARALANSQKYSVINEVLILYRTGESSLTNSFYGNVDFGIDSYLLAKKNVLTILNNERIKLSVLRQVLAVLRMSLAQKKYSSAQKIFNFIKEEHLAFSCALKIKIARIAFFYFIFKNVKRGNTRFNKLLKI